MTIVTISETPVIITADSTQVVGPPGPPGATSYGAVSSVNAVVDHAATSFDGAVKSVRILGYSTIGIGEFNVRRVPSQPSHGWRFRSLDRFTDTGATDLTNGGWWEGYAPDNIVTPEMFGAKGDNVTDDYAAITACIAYAESQLFTGTTLQSTISIRFRNTEYYSSQTLVSNKTTRYFCGEGIGTLGQIITTIRFPANTTGWSIPYAADTGVVLKFENIQLYGTFNRSVDAPDYIHGWAIQREVHMIGCGAASFPGNGFNINGASDGNIGSIGGGGTHGNTDFSRFQFCFSQGNGMNGFYCYGADANVMVFDQCHGFANLQFGFRDDGFLGNYYNSCHTSGNGSIWIARTPYINAAGKTYVPIPVSKDLKLTNTVLNSPETDPTVWRLVYELGPNGLYNWDAAHTPPYQPGGAYCLNGHAMADGLYAEGGQSPSWSLPQIAGTSSGDIVWGEGHVQYFNESGFAIVVPHKQGSTNPEDINWAFCVPGSGANGHNGVVSTLSGTQTGQFVQQLYGGVVPGYPGLLVYEAYAPIWSYFIAGSHSPTFNFGAAGFDPSGTFTVPKLGLNAIASNPGVGTILDWHTAAPTTGYAGIGWLRLNTNQSAIGPFAWTCTTGGQNGVSSVWKEVRAAQGPYTVSTLPAAGTEGRQAWVTDGDAALAWGATVVNSGAGATKYLVWDNGAAWTVVGK